MSALFRIDDIIDSPLKIGILRILCRGKGFKATGREISRLVGFSVPSTHESLKDLHVRNILTLEIMSKQHIYALNEEDRIVQKVIRPMFEVEAGFKNEISRFVKDQMQHAGIIKKISSVMLYGSLQKGKAIQGSDVDIAIVVNNSSDVEHITEVFSSGIAKRFKIHFGVQLDPYIKSVIEFKGRLKKSQPPIADLMKSYFILYGKEPLEL